MCQVPSVRVQLHILGEFAFGVVTLRDVDARCASINTEQVQQKTRRLSHPRGSLCFALFVSVSHSCVLCFPAWVYPAWRGKGDSQRFFFFSFGSAGSNQIFHRGKTRPLFPGMRVFERNTE